jgi:hypothetical protein
MPASLLSPVEPISFVSRSTRFDSPDWLSRCSMTPGAPCCSRRMS